MTKTYSHARFAFVALVTATVFAGDAQACLRCRTRHRCATPCPPQPMCYAAPGTAQPPIDLTECPPTTLPGFQCVKCEGGYWRAVTDPAQAIGCIRKEFV